MFVSRAPLSFPKDKKWHRETEGFRGGRMCGPRMAATKDHGRIRAWTRLGFQSKERTQPQAEASFLPWTSLVWCLLLVLFPLLMYFIHNLFPVPFPCNAIVEVVLGLVLLNWVVPLGSQKEAISWAAWCVCHLCFGVTEPQRERTLGLPTWDHAFPAYKT